MPSIKSAHFKIGDLFYGQSGNRLTKEDMIPGETNYIGAISTNNGVREHIHADDVDVFPGNCITVNYNGSVGEAFYQDEPFWPSDDVNVLYAREDWILDREIGLFIVTVIKANRFKFDYGRKWILNKLLDTEIPLPVTEDGNPDWGFIRSFMRSLHWIEGL